MSGDLPNGSNSQVIMSRYIVYNFEPGPITKKYYGLRLGKLPQLEKVSQPMGAVAKKWEAPLLQA